jgi:hypothetical protein
VDKREHTTHEPGAPPLGGLGAYLTISGRGEPVGSLFEAKVAALYSVVYAVKLGMGRSGRDITIGALEGFWTLAQDGPRLWKLGIPAPLGLGPRDLAAAIATLAAKGKDPLVKDVLLEALDERQLERFPTAPEAAVAATPL